MIIDKNISDYELDILIDYYNGLLEYLVDNNNCLICGVYTNNGPDAVGTIDECNYYFDESRSEIACGTYHSYGKKHLVDNNKLLEIQKHLKKLISIKQRRKNIIKLKRILKLNK
jgi:hypothetical protein